MPKNDKWDLFAATIHKRKCIKVEIVMCLYSTVSNSDKFNTLILTDEIKLILILVNFNT